MSQLFPSHSQSIGALASASVLPMNILGWFPLGLTGLVSLLSKGLSRVFNTTVWKHQFFGTQPSLWPKSNTERIRLLKTYEEGDADVWWRDLPQMEGGNGLHGNGRTCSKAVKASRWVCGRNLRDFGFDAFNFASESGSPVICWLCGGKWKVTYWRRVEIVWYRHRDFKNEWSRGKMIGLSGRISSPSQFGGYPNQAWVQLEITRKTHQNNDVF